MSATRSSWRLDTQGVKNRKQAQPLRREEGEADARKGPAPKRPLVVDPVYQVPLVTQLVNKILLDGKKSIAEGIVYGARGLPRQDRHRPGRHPKRALDNIKPTLEVKSRRVGGATYQVPVEVKPAAPRPQPALAGRLPQARVEKTMTERLA